MKNFKLDVSDISQEQDFSIIYKGKDGLIEIKTCKKTLFEKLQYFNQRRNELSTEDNYLLVDTYEIDIFKKFIESIHFSEIIINENNCPKYYELSRKYGYHKLKQSIDKFYKEHPEFVLQDTDNFSNISNIDESVQEDMFLKEDLIAQNLDANLSSGFLKKLPRPNICRILNSPKRKIIDHHLLFDFVIDQIKNYGKYRHETDKDEENVEVLISCLDYTKMSINEIELLFSLEKDLTVFHPRFHAERMKTFIYESKEQQTKLMELEKMLLNLILKEDENEKKITQLEQVILKEKENEKKISQLEQVISSFELKFTDLREYVEDPRKKCQEIVDQINSGHSTMAILPYGIPRVPSKLFNYNSLLKEVKIPHSCSIIGCGAFFECTSLVNVEIPPSVIEIGPSAFFNCKSLSKIILPDSIISIGANAFNRCLALAEINIPYSVVSIGCYAFVWCSSLKKILLPQSVRTIGYDAFGGCSSLEEVKYFAYIKDIGNYAFPTTAKIIKYGDTYDSIIV